MDQGLPRELREQVARGPEDRLYVRKARLSDYPDMAALCHWHDDVELFSVLEGHMEYTVDRAVVRLGEGEGIFVNSRRLHYGWSRDRTECVFLCVLLDPLLVSATERIERRYVAPLTDARAAPFLHLSRGSGVLERVGQIWDAYRTGGDGFELEIQALFYQIWGDLWRQASPGPAEQARAGRGLPDRTVLREILRWLPEHLEERLSTADLAAAGNVSERKCYQLFRDYTGRSPLGYLTGLRLREARRLLGDTDLSMTEIAGRTGLGGPSYFSGIFRRHHGCTPTAWRARRRSGDGRGA